MANIRIYTYEEFKVGKTILMENSVGHYLVNVMRAKRGDLVALFNGKEGEWRAEIIKIGRGKASLTIREQLRPQSESSDLWYLFAPLKKARMDYMMQKAAELGVSLIRPIQTEHTHMDRIKWHKMEANVIEASEQSGRLTVPKLEDMIKLPELLKGWQSDRKIIFCDEVGDADTMISAAEKFKGQADKWAVLIGPEGGFSKEERELIRSHPAVVPITLGHQILRADTAGVAALSLWQATFGLYDKRLSVTGIRGE